MTIINKAREEHLFFVFHGQQRPLETLKGLPSNGETVFEARAYPSLEYATGESWEEAKDNLRDLLDREIGNAKSGADEWYAEKLAELSDQDRKALFAAAFKTLTGREESFPITVGSKSSIVLDDIEGGAGGCTTEEEPCSGRA